MRIIKRTMNSIIIVALIIFLGCNIEDIPRSNKFMPIIEKGTDSSYGLEYYPNPNKTLYVILSKWYNAPIETFFYYHDLDKKKVSRIKTYMIDSLYGHYFEFYENGNLMQYCYYTGLGNQYSYLKRYSEDGSLEIEEGNPYVDYIENNNKELELHFSTVFFDSLVVELSTNSICSQKISLKKSSLLPMLLESKIPKTDNLFYLKIVGYNKNQITNYFDTLNIM
jgi:hypothetical protein